MPDRITRTQIDFRRPPAEWGPQLYRLLNNTIDALNDDVMPKLEEVEGQAEENRQETALVKSLII
jgi:hypothetical protein